MMCQGMHSASVHIARDRRIKNCRRRDVATVHRTAVCDAGRAFGTAMKLRAGPEDVEEGAIEALLPSEAVGNETENSSQGNTEKGPEGESEPHRVEIKFEDPWRRMDPYEIQKYKKRNRDLLCRTSGECSSRSSTQEDCSEASDKKLLQDSLSEIPEPSSHRRHSHKCYKRRFYILFLFSAIGFSQYCCWNTYGPIASTAKLVFGWTNTEVAVLASMDPITYLFTMLFFSWVMDEKGLRLSMLASTAMMFVGTGLRCVTSDSRYAIWSMGAGQLLNGLAGPVTQAAPPLLSASWFPSEQRTTATAAAALCGSLGVALSFIIGPKFVIDIKSEMNFLLPRKANHSANISAALERYLDRSIPYADALFTEAVHYWPMDRMNTSFINVQVGADSFNVFHVNDKKRLTSSNRLSKEDTSASRWRTEIVSKVVDVKGGGAGQAFGNVITSQGILNGSVSTDGVNGWIRIGHFISTCLGEPTLCKDGLTVSLWLKYNRTLSQPQQYFLGTSGTMNGYRGFLIYQDFENDNRDHLNVKVENGTRVWRRSFLAPSDTWIHVSFTWTSRDGLIVYINGSLVGYDSQGEATAPIQPYYTTLTLGRPNDKLQFSRVTLDDLAVWYSALHPREIEAMFARSAGLGLEADSVIVAKVTKRLKTEGKAQIMNLLYVEFGVVTALFLAVVVYFPDKPPTPPSHSARFQRENFFEGAKQIFRNAQFWTLALVYGATTGVYSGWGASLAVNLETFNISQNEAGWIGFYATIAGIGSGLLLARGADLFGRRMKVLLLVLFFGSAGAFLWFSLLCLRMIDFDNGALYKSSIIGGFFVSGTIPLFYELTVESTYPVAEGVTTGALTMINNACTVIFLLVLMIPGVGTEWMNWCMFGACAGCIPVMMGFQEKYKRLDIDKSSKPKPLAKDVNHKTATEIKEATENNNRASTSVMSTSHMDELVNRLKKCQESDL